MTSAITSLSVIGLGKLGSPMVASFAAKGFTVVGVDLDPAKVEAINRLEPPVFEPGLAEMLERSEGRLSATTDVAAAVAATEATFIIVPTPSDETGTFSIDYALAACEAIGGALAHKDDYHLVVLTSTVMPGATGGAIRDTLERTSGKRYGEDFGLCYSPEFIALGSVIRDLLNPDFLLVGESDERAGALLAEIYSRTCENSPPVARMNFVNAELAKISVNSYVTTKIAFANMLARICERLPESDVDVVTAALGMDTRIGAKYLKGAVSYGGPCFPRDNIALAALARGLNAPAIISEATDRSNRGDVVELAELVSSRLNGASTVGILGLSYKPHTDVVEESAGIYLARNLAENGVSVVAFDPAANGSAERALVGSAVEFAESAAACVEQADVVVLMTPWPEFRELTPEQFARPGAGRVLVDCWRFFEEARYGGATEYVALGRGATVALPLSP